MKKIIALLFCLAFLSSCSFFAAPTPEPTRETTNTPTFAPTSTPTVLTPTFTVTPTLAGQKTQTFTPEFTSTVVTDTPLPLILTSTIGLATSAPMKGFINVSVSGSEFYKGKICSPSSVKFSAQAIDPIHTEFVVLFVRFKSKYGDVFGEWTNITMPSISPGTYVYELTSEVIKNVDFFDNAWVQYQFVATDSKLKELGRTEVFSEKLTLLNCNVTPTPMLSP